MKEITCEESMGGSRRHLKFLDITNDFGTTIMKTIHLPVLLLPAMTAMISTVAQSESPTSSPSAPKSPRSRNPTSNRASRH